MPGYKALPEEFDGPAADQVRYAEVLQRAGDAAEAVRLLELTLESCVRMKPELPGWLCGRLAALYRALKRYDDEVLLLERYRESQTSEDARTRFDARLSKARAIAERKRRTDTRALASVRRVITGRDDDDVVLTPVDMEEGLAFRDETMTALREALVAATQADAGSGALASAVERLCAEAREQEHPPERMVAALRLAWRITPRPPLVPAEHWRAVYQDALARSLAIHFADVER
ncbi:MAG TPA: hypothetical protein VFY85_09335 [Gemmatimonadaceae bacterium]|nr:hypothetical protein [Gemmatimonadaceae bacterium]